MGSQDHTPTVLGIFTYCRTGNYHRESKLKFRIVTPQYHFGSFLFPVILSTSRT